MGCFGSKPKAVVQGFDSMHRKELIAISCWYLWWMRRCRTHDEPVPPMGRCKISILTMAANFVKASKPTGPMSQNRWSKPPPRHVKLNVDASFHEDTKSGATGAIIRDYQGLFIAACGRFIPHVSSPAMAEAMAMKEGLTLVNHLGVTQS